MKKVNTISYQISKKFLPSEIPKIKKLTTFYSSSNLQYSMENCRAGRGEINGANVENLTLLFPLVNIQATIIYR